MTSPPRPGPVPPGAAAVPGGARGSVPVGALLDPAPTRVMGIVNVTPDSFSDGGRWASHEDAIARAQALIDRGADLVDVGGESTRPGSTRVPVEAEIERVVPVIRELAGRGIVVSVDTINSSTALAAVDAGARIVNDVSGGLHDPQMHAVVADLDVLYVLQHWRGTPDTMNDHAVYDDVVAEVRRELTQRMEEAAAAGLPHERIVLDPGLGFAKNPAHNWALLAHLDALQSLGRPVLIGASRKRFVAGVVPARLAADAGARDHATDAITVLCAQAGVWGVRVHEVAGSVDAVRVVRAVRAASGSSSGTRAGCPSGAAPRDPSGAAPRDPSRTPMSPAVPTSMGEAR